MTQENEHGGPGGDELEVSDNAPEELERLAKLAPALDGLREVTEEELRAALDPQPQEGDKFAGIVIAQLEREPVRVGELVYFYYGARVYPGKHVNPHYHQHGEEPYGLRAGEEAVMHLGDVEGEEVAWRPGEQSRVGDEIIVQEREVHSLENTGEVPLDFAFACPKAHLTEEDRVFTMDMPNGLPDYQSSKE